MFELSCTTFLVAIAVCFGSTFLVHVVLGQDAADRYFERMTVVFFEVMTTVGCLALVRQAVTKYIWHGDTAKLYTAVAFVTSMACIVTLLHGSGILGFLAPRLTAERRDRTDEARP